MKRKSIQRIGRSASVAAFALCAMNVQAQPADAVPVKPAEKEAPTALETKELKPEAGQKVMKDSQTNSFLPDWVTSRKFNGELRGRYEGFYSENSDFVQRNRYRYRLRLGVEATLNGNFDIGARLGSGDPVSGFGTQTGNPVSGNSTLQDNSSKKYLYIDLAYARWRAFNSTSANGSLTFGKMESPFSFSHMVFDPDYTPEGLAAQFTYNFNSQHALKAIGGLFVLDELGLSSRDPFLSGAQILFESAWSKHLSTSVGVAMLGINSITNLPNSSVANVNRGNSRYPSVLNPQGVDTTSPTEHFNPIVADASMTYTVETFPGYKGPFPTKVVAEYLNNPATSTKNQGVMGGVTFGKAGKKGQWEAVYQYRYLAANAWYEELADDDFGAFYQAELPNSGFINANNNPQGAGYGGGTNVRGHVARVAYSFYDSLTFSINYYKTLLINENPPGSKSGMTHLMVDLTWKF